jgi:hypothetical protein
MCFGSADGKHQTKRAAHTQREDSYVKKCVCVSEHQANDSKKNDDNSNNKSNCKKEARCSLTARPLSLSFKSAVPISNTSGRYTSTLH